MKVITQTATGKVFAGLRSNSNIYLERKISFATVGGLNTLQIAHLRENVTVLAPPQNKKRKGMISLIMPKFHCMAL